MLKNFIFSIVRIFFAFLVFVLLLFQVALSIGVPSYGAWGIFHYYLGAKYIKEIGYFDLYSCAIEANQTKWQGTKLVRDLYSYKLIPIKQLPACPKNNFTKKRWEEFVKDTVFITNHATANYWSKTVTDKGFNPPPSWVAFTSPTTSIIPLNNNLDGFILFNFDFLFIVIAVIIVICDAGFTAGLVTAALTLLYFGTLNQFGNNFFQFAWYPLLAASFVSWCRKKPLAGGIALGLATGMQVFPGLFIIPVIFLWIKSLIKQHKINFKITSHFIVSFLLTLMFCFIIGSLHGGKITIWQQWYKKIMIQKNYIQGEIFDIGFANLIGTVASADHASPHSYIQEYPHTLARNEAIKHNQTILDLAGLLVLFLICYSIWKSKEDQPLVYGYLFIYFFLTLAPYYYLILALLPFLLWKNKTNVRKFVVYGIPIIFFLHLIVFWRGDYIGYFYTIHLFSKVLIFLFFAALLFLLLLNKEKKLKSVKTHSIIR